MTPDLIVRGVQIERDWPRRRGVRHKHIVRSFQELKYRLQEQAENFQKTEKGKENGRSPD
jgi:hypothetical protein